MLLSSFLFGRGTDVLEVVQMPLRQESAYILCDVHQSACKF